jgi:hypothetical protein
MKLSSFSAEIFIIGINPYVFLPEKVLQEIFQQAGKNKSPISVKGKLNGHEFKQTLVKYQGAWRLYLNGLMRQAAGIDVGDQAEVEIAFDPEPRVEPMNQKLLAALVENKTAKETFEKLPPSHQKEIFRYLNSMKTEESLTRNIEKVIGHLLGKSPPGLKALMRK